MKFFLDTEFEENGPHKPITLISIGIVSEQGEELYLENAEVQVERLGPWLQQNVVPHLLGGAFRKNYFEISQEIMKFVPPIDEKSPMLAAYDPPVFWGYFADYDWVVFCQLFGKMIDLPKGYPMFCMDLKQFSLHLGVPKSVFPKQPEGTEHNALEDARWNKELYDFLIQHTTGRSKLK